MSYPHTQIFTLRFDAPKGPSYFTQNIVPQFYICYHKNFATWKLTYISSPKPGTGSPQSVGSRDLFCPISIMHKTFVEDSGNLKHHKNVKSIKNTKGSLLVSCVIPRPATMKGWEKEVFWKMGALGNLKCNKSNNLKFDNFSSILLNLQVTSFDSPEIETLFCKTHLNGYFCFLYSARDWQY